MGLADFYNQNGCSDIPSKIKALEKRMCQHPFNGMDKKKRLMLLEKEYCKMGSYHQEVNSAANASNFKDIYDQMLTNTESSYNKVEITPEEMRAQSINDAMQIYGREYYSPR